MTRPNRRQFLTGSAALFVSAGAATAPGLAHAMGGTTAAWQELIALADGAVFLPSTPGYGLVARVNNLRYMAELPHAVVVVDSAAKAAGAVQWCRLHQVPFRIKGGGHNYAGYSAGPELVIFTHGMNDMKIVDGTAIIGAGAINYDVYDELAVAGRSLTHGRCATVGVAGYLLGGGIGFDMRRFGMASDSLLSSDVVLADGSLVTASGTEHPDLFWALRGGAGGNFGLCTAFTSKTHKVSNEFLTVFHRQYISKDQGVMAGLTHRILSDCEAMPKELGTRMSVQYILPLPGTGEEPHFKIDFIGQWAGDRQDVQEMFKEWDHRVKAEVLLDFHGSYWVGQHLLEEPEELFYYQERSTFIPTTPDEAAVHEAFEHLKKRPPVHGTCDLRFFQTGGAVNDMAPDASAFVHRSSQWLPLIGFYWEDRDNRDPELIAKGHAWQDAFYEFILEGFNGAGAFQNFPDPSLSEQEFGPAYYGDNLARLQKVKAAYDPDHVFDFPQAIRAV